LSHTISLTPIAFVKSRFETNTPAEEIRARSSQLVVEPEFAPGLLGLEAGMDILIFFHFHLIQPEEIELQLHPRHNPANPLRGVFATRSQFRPNRIAATVARIESVEDTVITVSGLDALDGTPVLDIKPYAPYFDIDTSQQKLEVSEVTSLQEARDAIDEIDAEIIRLLGNRAGYVRQVVRFKKTAADVRAPARYAEVMRQRREMAEAAGLNPDVVEGMYRLLVDNFIKEEMEILQQGQQN
jgi:tRNA-Thr(GGU) m(6)t(6)A37 methyltransferase TsaA